MVEKNYHIAVLSGAGKTHVLTHRLRFESQRIKDDDTEAIVGLNYPDEADNVCSECTDTHGAVEITFDEMRTKSSSWDPVE